MTNNKVIKNSEIIESDGLLPNRKNQMNDPAHNSTAKVLLDDLPDYISFTYMDAFMIILSLALYIFDIYSDIHVSVLHFNNTD